MRLFDSISQDFFSRLCIILTIKNLFASELLLYELSSIFDFALLGFGRLCFQFETPEAFVDIRFPSN